MTKAYLKFPQGKISFLPKISSRRFKVDMNEFITHAYRKDAHGNEIPDESDADKAARTELLAKIQGMIDTSLATRATQAELQQIRTEQAAGLAGLPLDALRAMIDDKTGVMPKLIEQGLEIQRLKTSIKDSAQEDFSTRGQIKKWLESRSQEEGGVSVADLVKDIVINKTKRNLPPLEIRAVASPMLTSTVNAGASPFIGRVEIEPGINDFIRTQPNFWNFLSKGRTNAPLYVWINKTNPQGAAAFIGPGVAKPGVSFELVAENSVAKKIADSAKAGTELLQDIDGMATFIEQELRYQVMIKVNSTLMSSAGSSTVPTGIQNLSTTFTNATIKTTNATYVDAIRAVIGQLRSGLLTGEITVFINPADAANMDMSKAVDSGVYLLPPFASPNGMIISGVRVIEDFNIPVGFIQAGFMRFYRILIYKDFTVSWGWENDDFTKNLVTAVGEMRLHQFFNDIYTGAFVYDSFANVIAAINTP